MSAGARVAIFVALLAATFVAAVFAGRAVHPRSGVDGGTHSGGAQAAALARVGGAPR